MIFPSEIIKHVPMNGIAIVANYCVLYVLGAVAAMLITNKYTAPCIARPVQRLA